MRRARERELGVLRQPVEHVAQRRRDREEEQPAGARRASRRACASGVSSTRTPTVAPSSTSAGYARTPLPRSSISRGSVADVPRRQAAALELGVRGRQLGAQPRRDLLAQRGRGRRPRRRRGRRRPRSRTSCAGAPAAAGRPTRRGMRTPRSASSSRASASSSGSLRGVIRARTAAATSGTGTSGLRSSLGSERISAVTSSSRKRGDEPVEPDRAQLAERGQRDVDGHAVVRGAPARSGSVSGRTRSPCFHAVGRARGSSTSAAAGSTSSSRACRSGGRGGRGARRATSGRSARRTRRRPGSARRRSRSSASSLASRPRRRARSSSASTSSTQPPVVGDERVARLPVALDERAADEQLARERRVDPRVGDRAPGDDRQPVERRPARWRRPRRAGVPPRLAVACGVRGARRAARSTRAGSGRRRGPTAATSRRARPTMTHAAASGRARSRGRSRSARCARPGTRAAAGPACRRARAGPDSSADVDRVGLGLGCWLSLTPASRAAARSWPARSCHSRTRR